MFLERFLRRWIACTILECVHWTIYFLCMAASATNPSPHPAMQVLRSKYIRRTRPVSYVPEIAYMNGPCPTYETNSRPACQITSAAILPTHSPWRKVPMPPRKQWQRRRRRCSGARVWNLHRGSYPTSSTHRLKHTGSTLRCQSVWL